MSSATEDADKTEAAPGTAPDPSLPAIDRLIEVMAALRHPETGCPWDIEQTFDSIAPYTIEEAYEVAEAIAQKDPSALKDELGDLLLQVVYHARMAEEEGSFDFEGVADAITTKMIRRHPHVFAGASIADAEAQSRAWEEQKAQERKALADREGRTPSALDGVSTAYPALMRALKVQKRAARVGFDWTEARQILEKIEEEIAEFREVLDGDGLPDRSDRFEDELGDLLFSVVNLARRVDIDPETALRRCIGKFERRFRQVENRLAANGQSPTDSSLDELEAAWQSVKTEERIREKGVDDGPAGPIGERK